MRTSLSLFDEILRIAEWETFNSGDSACEILVFYNLLFELISRFARAWLIAMLRNA